MPNGPMHKTITAKLSRATRLITILSHVCVPLPIFFTATFLQAGKSQALEFKTLQVMVTDQCIQYLGVGLSIQL